MSASRARRAGVRDAYIQCWRHHVAGANRLPKPDEAGQQQEQAEWDRDRKAIREKYSAHLCLLFHSAPSRLDSVLQEGQCSIQRMVIVARCGLIGSKLRKAHSHSVHYHNDDARA